MKLGLAGAGRIGALHCATLAAAPDVDALLVADVDGERARALAAVHDADAVAVDDLFTSGLDALVVAAATDVHPDLVVRGVAAGAAVFCEKPLAADLAGSLRLVEDVERSGGRVVIGFQRRFDAGYRRARDAYREGRLGRLHTVRATTLDPSPPPAAYVAHSGGIFRDCSVHDFDVIRWTTGREVTEVYATGGNGGAEFFAAAGDVDTGVAVLTLDDETLAVVSSSRYNGAGHDVRLELMGERGTAVVGLDDRLPVRSAEPGVAWPPGPPYTGFQDRFAAAYAAEMTAFLQYVAGTAGADAVGCSPAEALAAFRVAEACQVSRREHRPVRLDEVTP